MPFPLLVPLAIAGISAAAGALGNRGSKQTSTGTTNVDNTTTTTPQYGNEENYFKNFIINSYLDRLQGNDDNYWNSFKMGGLQNLNRAEDNSSELLKRFMTSRGLGLTGAGASMGAQSGILGQFNKANYLNSIPMLRDQREQDNLKNSSAFMASLPYGQTSRQTGTTNSSGTVQQPSNMLGGGMTGLGSMLAFLMGQGAFNSGTAPKPGG
jgi:hypothetical protein